MLSKWDVQNKKHNEWLKRRIDTDLEVGSKVDIRAPDYVWTVGTVKLIIESIKREPVFVIHYDGLDSTTDEVIFKNSVRLAKHGTYTLRNDIPKCNSKLNNQVQNLPISNKQITSKVAQSE